MQSGIYWGYISLMEGMINRIRSGYNEPLTTIATGGVVSLFRGATSSIEIYDPDLTINGLLAIYQANKI
jgi:type III pantothenate kinase